MSFLDKIKQGLKTEPEVKTVSKKAVVKDVTEKKVTPKTTASTDIVKKSPAKKTGHGPEKFGVLIRALMTEKTTDSGKDNKYAFEVTVESNKIEIARAIETRYGVKPVKVNVVNNLGRVVRYGRSAGRTKAWKKAIITLPKGQSIKINESI